MASGPPPSESKLLRPPLRIVFMGTPEMAAHILERLIRGADATFEVVAVVTRTDRPRGRGLKLKPSPVATVAAAHGLPVLKPEKIRTPEFLGELKNFDPDLIVVAAYGKILPKAVLETARMMPLNVHASLLPRHRGAAPVEGALLAGDLTTGVTIMRMTEKMDAGPMLLSREIPIAAAETQGSLKPKLAELGAEALLEELRMLARGELRETPQDESQATYTSPVKKKDAVIDWSADAVRIERMTRAYDPWPVARTTLEGEELLVWRARVAEPASRGASPPGTLVALKPAPAVQCGAGLLELVEVQAPGRKRIAAADFVRGRRIAVGHRLGG